MPTHLFPQHPTAPPPPMSSPDSWSNGRSAELDAHRVSSSFRANGHYRENGLERSGRNEHRRDWDGNAEPGSSTPRQRTVKVPVGGVTTTTTIPVGQSPVREGTTTLEHTWFHEINAELADMITVILDSLLDVAPPQLLEPSREQFAACSVPVPAPTLASIYTGLKIFRSIARNSASLLRRPLAEDAQDAFDIGDLLQSVGDMVSGMAAMRGVELVIYHGDDSLHDQGQQAVKAVDFNPIYVKGNEGGLTYVLAHIVRQVLETAKSGDSIEFGLFVYSPHRPDLQDLDNTSDPVYGLPTRCIIDIAHKFGSREPRPVPNLETSLLQRLLNNADAELTLNSLFRPQFSSGRSCELGFTLPSCPPPVFDSVPQLVHGVGEQPILSHEPTFDQLYAFAHVLKDRKISVTVYTRELSTEPLLASLSNWGVDLAVIGNGESAGILGGERPTKGSKPFIFIDDDIDILKQQLQAANPNPTKRPAIHRVQSSNHVVPRQSSGSITSITIVYFTSLNNFKLIKEVIRAALYPFAPYPEIIVVPKPVGPRRLLTILHTAVTKPRIDPTYSPSATSPGTSIPNASNASMLSPSPSTELPKPGSPRPPGTRTNSDRSIRKDTMPSSPLSPANEYFPNSKISDNNPLTGIRMQDSEGAMQGIYFNPKVKSTPPSPRGVGAIPVTDTFASMLELARTLPPDPESPAFQSPLDHIYLSRRNTTPHGTTVPRLGPEHNVVPPIQVLVVDDNRINREICDRALKKIGVKTGLAKNGKEALDAWRTGKFHMILMDIQMPVMGGLEATKHIRSEEKVLALAGLPRGTPLGESNHNNPTPPIRTPSEVSSATTPYPSSVVIVALTASRDEEDRVQALAAGCNDFLTKPVSTMWLHNKVTEWGSIKALQQWAPAQLPESITQTQVERANRVASGLVPPIERRTPSPGHSRRREPITGGFVDVASPSMSGRPQSATDSMRSWGTEPSPMTFHGTLGVPTPVSGGFSPRGSQTSYSSGSGLNIIDELDVIHVGEQEHDDELDVDGERDEHIEEVQSKPAGGEMMVTRTDQEQTDGFPH